MKTPQDMQTGTIHNTNNFGVVIVKEYTHANRVCIQFVKTGYTTWVRSGNIRKGTVKDLLHPCVCGVGFTGVGSYSHIKDTKAHRAWNNMLIRCYCEIHQKRKPSYTGCSVTVEWHNFQVFSAWYYDNYPHDCGEYDLDKDILIEGNKIYGPDTCLFVSSQENATKASAKHHCFMSPEGGRVEVYNLSNFCRENKLQQTHMWSVQSGKRNHHKGWTKA